MARDTFPAIRVRHNAGFQNFGRERSPWSAPIVTRDGSARFIQWAGFLPEEDTRGMKRVKVAIVAYADCDVYRRWQFVDAEHFALGVLGPGHDGFYCYGVMRNGLAVVGRSPGGVLITDPECPAYRDTGL